MRSIKKHPKINKKRSKLEVEKSATSTNDVADFGMSTGTFLLDDEIGMNDIQTGTFSAGINLIYASDNSISLVEAKNTSLDFSNKAKLYLKNFKNKKQAKQAIDFLIAIEKSLSSYEGIDFSGIRMAIVPDSSISISWRVKTALFGAAIRPDANESSWFLIQGDVEKGYKADGYLSELDYEIQLPTLLQLLINVYLSNKR